jgi:Domain of unknown function (DUF1905)
VTSTRYSFAAEVWEQPSTGAWHFVSLPTTDADDIEEAFGRRAAGFGSIRVEVTIGTTTWQTSLFPDSKRATYVLPVKKSVRVAEGLEAGSTARVDLTIVG